MATTTLYHCAPPNEVADYLLREVPDLKWGRKETSDWIEWFRKDNRITTLHDSLSGHIIALGMARCVNFIEDARHWYAHSPIGSIVWIEYVAGGRKHFRELFDCLKGRFTHRDFIAFNRIKYGRHRIYPFSKIDNALGETEL